MEKENKQLGDLINNIKKKGYFDLSEHEGTKLSWADLMRIKEVTNKYGIPTITSSVASEVDQKAAAQIIASLRRGVPPPSHVNAFNVGRKSLIGGLCRNLREVSQGQSIVEFMNADYGSGKTHSLYMLREFAFEMDFAVSIVTLSHDSCPIHDFMLVYKSIMWNLRTKDERDNPALDSVLGRWLEKMSQISKSRDGQQVVKRIVGELPEDMKEALHSYYESTSFLKHKEQKRMLVLDYLSGEKVHKYNLKKINVQSRIDESNALFMLGKMALLFRNLGYKGICIFFDEAESLYSFGSWKQKDLGYDNLRMVMEQSREAPRCYFLYATTPSFFTECYHYIDIDQDEITELTPLTVKEMGSLASRACSIYSVMVGNKVPRDVENALSALASHDKYRNNVGDFVRSCVAILDTKMKSDER